MIIRDSQSVLKDYYESGASYYQIARKYDVATGNVIAWERKYMNKCVPLPSDIQELEKRVFMAKNMAEIGIHINFFIALLLFRSPFLSL